MNVSWLRVIASHSGQNKYEERLVCMFMQNFYAYASICMLACIILEMLSVTKPSVIAQG